jgi:hypothetical protein
VKLNLTDVCAELMGKGGLPGGLCLEGSKGGNVSSGQLDDVRVGFHIVEHVGELADCFSVQRI